MSGSGVFSLRRAPVTIKIADNVPFEWPGRFGLGWPPPLSRHLFFLRGLHLTIHTAWKTNVYFWIMSNLPLPPTPFCLLQETHCYLLCKKAPLIIGNPAFVAVKLQNFWQAIDLSSHLFTSYSPIIASGWKTEIPFHKHKSFYSWFINNITRNFNKWRYVYYQVDKSNYLIIIWICIWFLICQFFKLYLLTFICL